MIRTFKETRDDARRLGRSVTEAVLRADDTVETITFGPRGGWHKTPASWFKTRRDLARHHDFAHLDTDGSGLPCVWMNEYSCRVCTSEQVDWTSEWSCQCDDECPSCGRPLSPVASLFLGGAKRGDEARALALWNALPE